MKLHESKNILLEKNISYIPKKYESAYRFICQNLYFIDGDNERIFYEVLFNQYRQLSLQSSPSLISELIIQHPNSSMFDDFFKYNRLEGKRDISLLGTSVDEILKSLVIRELSKETNSMINDLTDSLVGIRNVFILSDLAISGNTLAGEIKDTINILRHIGLSRHCYRVNCLIIHSTKSALKLLMQHADHVYTIKQIPDEVSIISDAFKENCTINYSNIMGLQQWFSKNIVANGSRLSKMSRVIGSPTVLEFGYNEQGWMIVSDLNTPNNTLPLLWYDEHETYRALFPRASSRLYENATWNLRASLFKLLQNR